MTDHPVRLTPSELTQRLRAQGWRIPFKFLNERQAARLTNVAYEEYRQCYPDDPGKAAIRAAIGFAPPQLEPANDATRGKAAADVLTWLETLIEQQGAFQTIYREGPAVMHVTTRTGSYRVQVEAYGNPIAAEQEQKS